jgi:hypothetical protein
MHTCMHRHTTAARCNARATRRNVSRLRRSPRSRTRSSHESNKEVRLSFTTPVMTAKCKCCHECCSSQRAESYYTPRSVSNSCNASLMRAHVRARARGRCVAVPCSWCNTTRTAASPRVQSSRCTRRSDSESLGFRIYSITYSLLVYSTFSIWGPVLKSAYIYHIKSAYIPHCGHGISMARILSHVRLRG